ncbi:PilZ domain-containing protein [Ectothiorhodospiraceae bacterium 2226]|nr:PilZ domain-containing protein [Ectothiorhodospiraceae bacterium 2226]
MEHRWSKRKALKLDVLLYHRGMPIARSRSRNIGLEGMCVDAGIELPEHAPVDVEFELMHKGRRRRHRLPAVVVHRTEEATGLMFRTFDRAAFQAIEEYIYLQGQAQEDIR